MDQEPVDAIDQLMMMLAWYDEYTDEFKRKCIIRAIVKVQRMEGRELSKEIYKGEL